MDAFVHFAYEVFDGVDEGGVVVVDCVGHVESAVEELVDDLLVVRAAKCRWSFLGTVAWVYNVGSIFTVEVGDELRYPELGHLSNEVISDSLEPSKIATIVPMIKYGLHHPGGCHRIYSC